QSGLPAFCNRQSIGQALLWKWPYLSPWLGANFSTPGMAIYTILFTPSDLENKKAGREWGEKHHKHKRGSKPKPGTP
ncbi:MAG: hypothetical protein KKE83_11275, partial [Proteobacteria bacterium]|nr:hypothetical protein [Pseudomonadota bacterium]